MVKVSVIVPIYKVERFLAGCLDSLITQSFEDIEIICVNDGSPDNCAKILEHYAKFDTRIKIINKENGGLSSARNAGLAAAEGEYIFFLDSDDRISSIAIETLYKNAQKNKSDIVIFDYIYKDYRVNIYQHLTVESLGNKYENESFNLDTIPVEIYKHLPVTVTMKFYRADLIKNLKFHEGIIFEDVPYTMETLALADYITYMPMPLYYYNTENDNSITKKSGKEVLDIIKIYNYCEDLQKKYSRLKPYSEQIKIKFIMDFIRLYYKLSPENQEEYFNLVKNLNINFNYEKFLSKEHNLGYAELENFYIQRFKILQESDFREFSNLTYEVPNV